MTAPAGLRWFLRDLSIGYTTTPVASGLAASFALGDLVAMTGNNGSGKSCLLQTLAGGLQPLAGTIDSDGAYTSADVGVVPQVTDLQIRLPVSLREMVALGLTGLPAVQHAVRRERVDQALAMVDLEAQAGQPWQASSGGERQRALAARALVRQPRLLLLDEPTSHCDPDAADQLFEQLSVRCAQRQSAVIVVVHDLTKVASYATHEWHLEGGTLRTADLA